MTVRVNIENFKGPAIMNRRNEMGGKWKEHNIGGGGGGGSEYAHQVGQCRVWGNPF